MAWVLFGRIIFLFENQSRFPDHAVVCEDQWLGCFLPIIYIFLFVNSEVDWMKIPVDS